MLILAWVGHLPLRLRAWSGLLLGAVIVQSEVFVLIRALSGFAAAFHPVLAAALFWGGAVVLQKAWAVLRHSQRPVAEEAATRASVEAGEYTTAAVESGRGGSC